MERVCSSREDVATFGHQIRRLARKAYPNNDLPERVLIDLFIRGLPSEEMKRHVSSFEPNSLAEAIRRATLCETYGEKTSKSKKPLPDDTVATIMKTKPVQTALPPATQFQSPPPQLHPSPPQFQPPPPSFLPQAMPPPLMQIPLSPPTPYPSLPRSDNAVLELKSRASDANRKGITLTNALRPPLPPIL